MSLDSLPAEIIYEIADLLTGHDIWFFAVTNRRLWTALQDRIDEYRLCYPGYHCLKDCDVWTIVPEFLLYQRLRRYPETIQNDNYIPQSSGPLSIANGELLIDAIEDSDFYDAWLTMTLGLDLEYESYDLLLAFLLTLLPNLKKASLSPYRNPAYLKTMLRVMPTLAHPPLESLTNVTLFSYDIRIDLELVHLFIQIPSLRVFRGGKVARSPNDEALEGHAFSCSLKKLILITVDIRISQFVELLSRVEGLEELSIASDDNNIQTELLLPTIARQFGTTLQHLDLGGSLLSGRLELLSSGLNASMTSFGGEAIQRGYAYDRLADLKLNWEEFPALRQVRGDFYDTDFNADYQVS